MRLHIHKIDQLMRCSRRKGPAGKQPLEHEVSTCTSAMEFAFAFAFASGEKAGRVDVSEIAERIRQYGAVAQPRRGPVHSVIRNHAGVPITRCRTGYQWNSERTQAVRLAVVDSRRRRRKGHMLSQMQNTYTTAIHRWPATSKQAESVFRPVACHFKERVYYIHEAMLLFY